MREEDIMKYIKGFIIYLIGAMVCVGCTQTRISYPAYENVTKIEFDEELIKVDGEACNHDMNQAVYLSNDIIYYRDSQDFRYGEGSEADAHSQDEANKHTVVNITKPGAYQLNGQLSLGQVAVDLGDEAAYDPQAKVILILDGIDLTCEVAPAIIFYNVYECGQKDEAKATKDVDTSLAGANVIIKDGSVNHIKGSYVAKIYKPESVVLSDDKTKVEDAKKLHKYDGAFYSKMSMNVFGESQNTGVLNIEAENEGLDSELHLTINGGNINIVSGNDGINTNEDNVSVTTINGGSVNIIVNGKTGEGDGIDSNGWLVINGGSVSAQSCASSGDAGIDSDKGIYIYGGHVIASGHMLDHIEGNGQNYAVFRFDEKLESGDKIILMNQSKETVKEYEIENSCSIVIYSSPLLKVGDYTLMCNDKQLSYTQIQGGHEFRPMGEPPGGFEPDKNMTFPDRERPDPNFKLDDFDKDHIKPDRKPDEPLNKNDSNQSINTKTFVFHIQKGANMFNGISK